MNFRKYHRNVFWEARFDNFFEDNSIKTINFTMHVKENQYKEGKRIYDLNDITIDFLKKGTIFEVETIGEKIVKIVVRNKYKDGNDICTALAVDYNELKVKTCYLNSQTDEHDTLDVKKYYNPYIKKERPLGATASIGDLIKYKNIKR